MTSGLAEGWPDWGDIPTWLVFFGAAIAAWRLIALERQRDRAAERDTVWAQARAVSAWWRWLDGADSAGTKIALGEVLIKNSSEAPIYDVYVHLYAPHQPGPSGGGRVVVAPPGETAIRWSVDPRPMASDQYGDTYPVPVETFMVLIMFRDAAGSTWERTQHGRLWMQSASDQSGDPHPRRDWVQATATSWREKAKAFWRSGL